MAGDDHTARRAGLDTGGENRLTLLTTAGVRAVKTFTREGCAS